MILWPNHKPVSLWCIVKKFCKAWSGLEILTTTTLGSHKYNPKSVPTWERDWFFKLVLSNPIENSWIAHKIVNTNVLEIWKVLDGKDISTVLNLSFKSCFFHKLWLKQARICWIWTSWQILADTFHLNMGNICVQASVWPNCPIL